METTDRNSSSITDNVVNAENAERQWRPFSRKTIISLGSCVVNAENAERQWRHLLRAWNGRLLPDAVRATRHNQLERVRNLVSREHRRRACAVRRPAGRNGNNSSR